MGIVDEDTDYQDTYSNDKERPLHEHPPSQNHITTQVLESLDKRLHKSYYLQYARPSDSHISQLLEIDSTK